jgi:hypothetical protein
VPLGRRRKQPYVVDDTKSWGRIVEPDRLKVAVDLYPTTEGWFVYTRAAVVMSAHASSAKTITDTLLKLDSWLSLDLARSG